jgi:hypothetical protein
MLSFLLLVLLAATVKVLAVIAGTFIHPAQPALLAHRSCLLPLLAVLHKATLIANLYALSNLLLLDIYGLTKN